MGALDGRRALVTGASAGIGAATVRALADAGARVACLARRRDHLDALAEQVGGVAVAADVTDHSGVQEGVDRAASALGGLDLLVNNAGVGLSGLVADTTYEDWRRVFDVNVLGLLSVTQAALPHLRNAGAADLVNVSSMSGRRVPRATGGVYSASKHAVHALSVALRQELHGSGVRVAVVAPGMVDTEMGSGTGPRLAARDVARAITRLVAEPPEVNTFEVAVLPTTQEG